MNFIAMTLKENKMLIYYLQSLVYEIETNDVYKDFYENKNLFDFSDYPEDSKFFEPVNKEWLVNWTMKTKEK